MANVLLNVLGTFNTGIFDESAAEITAFDPINQNVFVVNGDSGAIDVLDVSNPAIPTLIDSLGISDFGGGVNSVAVKDDVVAVAVEANDAADAGQVVFFDVNDFSFLNAVEVGVLPDALTFTPDGLKIVVANEGEPVLDDDDFIIEDPQGSISIIDLADGVANAAVTTLDFTAFDDKVEDLRSDGVRIFPDRLPSVDFEPEFAAVSADSTTAFVTLQENNAIAVVNLETKAIEGIQPLGVKDFSKGLPELTTYDITDRGAITNGGEPLVTADGQTIELGGFSGLWFDGVADNGNLKFLAVPDRGPNGDPLDLDGNGSTESRGFLLPDYQARVVYLELNETTGEVTITDELFLTQEDGTPITGLPNIPNDDRQAVDALNNPVDLPELTQLDASVFGADYDPFGADLEGIVRANDGTFWMVDEYRPAIYHFTADGKLINRLVPEGTVESANANNPGANFAPETFGAETLPADYLNRRRNRGFEAVALDAEEGKLYAFIQTPLNNPDRAAGDASQVIRVLEVDIETNQPTAEYVYLLQDPQIGNNVDKIGDAVYAGDGKFFVMERDSSLDSTAQKFVFEVDMTGATDVLGLDFGGETLEEQTPDDLAAAGITTLNKVKVTNLPSIGYLPSDKPEGLALLDDGRLAVLNDNDFGLEPGAEAVQLGIISFTGDNGLDASDRDDGINITNEPVFGLFLPDAIATIEADGQTFYITANEGDDRDDADSVPFGDAVRVKDLGDVTSFGRDGLSLDERFDPILEEDEELGRLVISSIDGDLDGDGDLDQIFTYGTRSFSIFDELGNLVFDSGDALEQITAAALPDEFNSTNDENDSFENRSDNKGPEPEGVAVGVVDGETYAFIGLERIGGVVVYNVSDPTAPEFVQYLNNRDFTGDAEEGTAGDLGAEGLAFISAEDSPTGRPALVVGNEVSGSTTFFDFGATTVGTDVAEELVGANDSNDAVQAGAGDDTVAGRLGDDIIYGGDGDDILRGDRNSRKSGGTVGGDDIIFGGAGDDRIGGKGGNDTLFGDEGDDQLWGDDGDDILRGGLGNDVLTGDDFSGGQGSDTFVLAVSEGTDTITDFEVGTDFIGLAGELTFGALAFAGNAISLADGTEVLAVLTGVDTTTLTAADFTAIA